MMPSAGSLCMEEKAPTDLARRPTRPLSGGRRPWSRLSHPKSRRLQVILTFRPSSSLNTYPAVQTCKPSKNRVSANGKMFGNNPFGALQVEGSASASNVAGPSTRQVDGDEIDAEVSFTGCQWLQELTNLVATAIEDEWGGICQGVRKDRPEWVADRM